MRRAITFVSFALLVISACTPRRPVPVVLPAADPSFSLIRSARDLNAARDYDTAADYFLRAAAVTPTADVRRRCLAAAALSYLKAGERERFLEAEARLEGELSEVERRLPPPEFAVVIVLGRLMRGEEPPRNLPTSVQHLVDDLRLDRRRLP